MKSSAALVESSGYRSVFRMSPLAMCWIMSVPPFGTFFYSTLNVAPPLI
jgi:hypothetical protein